MEDGAEFSMIEFWGQELPPGKQFSVEVENEPPVYQVVHITGCALGEAPKAGPHVLKVLNGEGRAIAIATLERGAAAQAPLDFGVSRTTVFANAGPSPVFVSGYITRSVSHFEGSDEDEDEGEGASDSDDDDELEDSDADEAPRAQGGAKKQRGSPFVDGEADEGSDDDEDMGGSSDEDEGEDEDDEDEEDEGDEFDRKLGGKTFASSSSGDDDGDSDDEGEGSDGEGLPDLDSDDMIAEATGSDDEEGSGDDDSDSDAPPQEKKSAAKRGAPLSTPQPAKKQKQDQPKAPASAPAKVQQQAAKGGKQQQQQQNGGGGGADAAYLASMVAFLKAEGKPVPLAVLGSKVARPEGFKPKVKGFVTAHAERFAFDEKAGTVALKQ